MHKEGRKNHNLSKFAEIVTKSNWELVLNEKKNGENNCGTGRGRWNNRWEIRREIIKEAGGLQQKLINFKKYM